MQNVDEIYLRDLTLIKRRAERTLVHAGPYGSRILDSFGPREAKGRFSIMAGTACSIAIFFVGLLSGFALEVIVPLCLVAAFAGGFLSVMICPWTTFQQYLSAVLAKCSDDTRLAPLRETIDRTDMAIVEKCYTILEQTAPEINKYRSRRKET